MALEADDSLTKWIVGAVAAGGLGLLAFLARWIFGDMTGQLRELRQSMEKKQTEYLAELRTVTAIVQVHTTQIAVLTEQLRARDE